jgi:hypothetical protein
MTAWFGILPFIFCSVKNTAFGNINFFPPTGEKKEEILHGAQEINVPSVSGNILL